MFSGEGSNPQARRISPCPLGTYSGGTVSFNNISYINENVSRRSAKTCYPCLYFGMSSYYSVVRVNKSNFLIHIFTLYCRGGWRDAEDITNYF